MATNLNPLSNQFLYSSPTQSADQAYANFAAQTGLPSYRTTPNVYGASTFSPPTSTSKPVTPSPTPSVPTNRGGYQGSGMDQGAYDLNQARQQELARQQDVYGQQRDQAYNDSNNYLNQAGDVAQSALGAAKQEAGSNYDVNASQLGNSQQTAFDTLNKQKATGTTSYENALADARRMFQEQQMGAQQRFGGSSSAGQAASEIQSREQARQFGQTDRQYKDLINNINTQHASVERDYQTGLMQLLQQKQASVQAAVQDFNNKLLQISNNRAQLSQAKAESSLQALQNLRNQVFAIEQQNQQFTQQLAMQRQQAQLALGQFGQNTNAYTTTSGNALQNTQYQQPTMATAAIGGLGAQQQQPQYQGAISNAYDPNRDFLRPLA